MSKDIQTTSILNALSRTDDKHCLSLFTLTRALVPEYAQDNGEIIEQNGL